MADESTSPDSAFLRVLVVAFHEGADAGLQMTLVLKGGERLSGVPEEATDEFVDPPEHVINIAGRRILAQEVREFTLALS
jgi:hypothetical protein